MDATILNYQKQSILTVEFPNHIKRSNYLNILMCASVKSHHHPQHLKKRKKKGKKRVDEYSNEIN